MATISGSVIFDRDRSASVSPADSGIANTPVTLQNVNTKVRLTVLTDSSGKYSFINVPPGNYRIVESYGVMDTVPSPGDFSAAKAGNVPNGANPPITAVSNPPKGATNLDCVTPDTLLVTVSCTNIINQNFLNGPVIYNPVQAILDPCAVISGENLIKAAANGTFGVFPQATKANTGAAGTPYPGVTPDFTYVLPDPDSHTPDGGEYTVQNIMNNSLSTKIGTWWRIADHTSGNETGRMMIVNGYNPGAVFFRDTIKVKPDTNYLFTSWILNLFKVNGYPDPELSVRILDQNGNILYHSALGTLIPVNVNAPEWKQVGSVINSQNNTSLTVEFISEGPEVVGNDYAIDDISFNEILLPEFIPVKTADKQSVNVGETVKYTVTLTNSCTSTLTDVFFKDAIPAGLTFVKESVYVNDEKNPSADPVTGFNLPDISGKTKIKIEFEAIAEYIPDPNPTVNRASITYSNTPVEGGIPGVHTTVSNDVLVSVRDLADISVQKSSNPNPVSHGDTLTYTILVSNAGPSSASNVVITDDLPKSISDAEVSVNGNDFYPWVNPLTLGTIACGDTDTISIRGKISSDAPDEIINTVIVSSDTPDPDLDNNKSTIQTAVVSSADISVIKKAQSETASPKDTLIYTIAVTNEGPGTARDVLLYDTAAELTNIQFSTDNGQTWQKWNNPYYLNQLESGENITILLRGTASDQACGTLSNTAVVTSTTPDPNPENNTSTAEINVLEGADLSVKKTVCFDPSSHCPRLLYKITVSNSGPSAAEQVTLTDVLPDQLYNPVYSSNNGRMWKRWRDSINLGRMPSGSSVSILLSGNVNACSSGLIKNTAVVHSVTPDPNTSNNSDSAEICICNEHPK